MKSLTKYIVPLMMSMVVIGCCHMDFYEELIISVSDVILDKSALELVEGESEKLVATVAPSDATDKSVVWSSSDASVVRVDEAGNVTAVGEGTATIMVTTADGSKTASCEVTVTAKIVSVSGVTLDKAALILKEGETYTLIAKILPENATNKSVIWSCDHNEVATVDESGKVTAVRAGSCTITVTTVDGGKTATCTMSVIGSVTGGTEEENTGGEGSGNINWD